jgi:predicted amidophosphoribosyltransferase
MRCPSCEYENRADRRFCAECGAALAASCPSCGTANQRPRALVAGNAAACDWILAEMTRCDPNLG